MYRDKQRYGQDPFKVVRSSPATFNKPVIWNREISYPTLVFTCSWSDFFIEEADAWRQEAWDIIRNTPNLHYQILTKRPERIIQCLPEDWGDGYPNVWIGVSVENQEQYDIRVPILINVSAHILFLSMEPLLGPIRINKDHAREIDWVIVGGESGNDTGDYRWRDSEILWYSAIVGDCAYWYDIPVWVKQLGCGVSKKLGLSSRTGEKMEEFPLELRWRSYPDKFCELVEIRKQNEQ